MFFGWRGRMTNWQNVLLTDSGFYYDNELDKPLTPLIEHFQSILTKPFSEAKVLFIPTAAMQVPEFAAEITERLCNELATSFYKWVSNPTI